MSGGFAHITAASEALGRLSEVRGFTPADKMAITQFAPYVEVGAVGPDYPYLGGQSEWADKMHYENTGEMIRNGIRVLRNQASGVQRERSISWLLGYAAHVATDLTVHPIVERRVGPYEDNQREHRACEMAQDAFIWPRRNLGELGLADYFDVNIRHCSTDDGGLDRDIVELWGEMLDQTYPDATEEPPEFDAWNKGFRRIVDTIDDAGSYFSFTRHLLADLGVVYPAADEIDLSYIENLQTPEGPIHYNDVFSRAVDSIVEVWSSVGEGIYASSEDEFAVFLEQVPNGNLDTGVSLDTGKLIYWRTA